MRPSDLETLLELLQRRLGVIGDAELRERDPDRQLSLLREVSEAISAFHATHRSEIPPRLNHFLENSSLEKAREWIEAELVNARK